MSGKVTRSPFRFGMIAGFLGVPLLWMAGDSVVLMAQGQSPIPSEAFWTYEASGALIGAFLGGQSAQIWSNWREGKSTEARGIAFITGILGLALYVGLAALSVGTQPLFLLALANRILSLVLQHHLPFMLCLLLVCGGLLGPRSKGPATNN